MMHICYLANSASIHTQRWAKYFRECGVRVSVISFSPHTIEGVECYYVRSFFQFSVKYLTGARRVRQLVHQLQPSVLHAHYATGYGFCGAVSGFHPFVLTCWGSDVLMTPKTPRLHRTFVRFNLKRADVVTSMAHHMTKTLSTLGVNPERIMTLPFGVDDRIFHPGLRPEGYASSSPTIICTRNFEREYNISLLLRSLPYVRARIPSVRCILAGDGSLRKELERETVQLGLQSVVEFKGSVSPSQIAKYLAECDVFCTVSYSDGNNISLNEAMACGCFPVATRIPANEEWIVEGENGFLVPLDDPAAVADAIWRALTSPELRQRAQARNWEIIQQRGNWRNQMERMDSVYEKLVSGQRLVLA